MKKKTVTWWAAAWACLAIAFLSHGADTARAAEVAEIRIADSRGDWGYPNPYRHYPRGPGYVRMSWVFDTLVWKDEKGYVRGLADQWSFDPGKMAFTFKLNTKAQWHDARPVTAQDVVFTLDYFKKHPYSWISVDSVGRAVAEDSHTVMVYLSRPYSPFLSDIGGTMPILPKHIWEGVASPQNFNDAKSFIGSGPYVFRDFNKAQGAYLYEAFEDYYQGRPKAHRLIYVRSGKPLVSLSSGEVDLASIQPEMAELLMRKGLKVIRDERGWNKKLMINHKKPPFRDRRFRQALAYAVDQREIIDKAHRGFASPASYGLLSPDHDMYNPDTPNYPYNPGKARDLIDSIGYERGLDGFYRNIKVELLASNITVAGQSVADRDGEVIKRQLEKIGLKVDLVNMEQSTTDSRVKTWEFDLAVSGHGGISGDPRILNEMISPKYGSGSVNSVRYEANLELNRLLETQMLEMNEEQRKRIVFQIQKVYAEDVPAISLYYPDTMAAYNPKKGIEWFFTRGGISKGIPIAQNKVSLLR